MRLPLILAPLALVAACTTAPPPQGVGFGDYQSYIAGQQAALAERPASPYALPSQPGSVSAPAQGQITSGPITTSQAPAAAAAPLDARQPAAEATQDAAAPTAAPDEGGAPARPARISDEQDFSAVSERETIESDRPRLEANREAYQEVAPQPLPERTETGPNIVEYALSVTNRVGQPVWRRNSLSLTSHERACASYASPDLAQQDFLRRGGPQRDPRNLDPDGDGFACSWDPTPFQRARTGG